MIKISYDKEGDNRKEAHLGVFNRFKTAETLRMQRYYEAIGNRPSTVSLSITGDN